MILFLIVFDNLLVTGCCHPLNFQCFIFRRFTYQENSWNLESQETGSNDQKQFWNAVQYCIIKEVSGRKKKKKLTIVERSGSNWMWSTNSEKSSSFLLLNTSTISYRSSSPSTSSTLTLSGLTKAVSSGFQITEPNPYPAITKLPKKPLRLTGNHYVRRMNIRTRGDGDRTWCNHLQHRCGACWVHQSVAEAVAKWYCQYTRP